MDALAERGAAGEYLVSPPCRTNDGFYEAVAAMPDGTLDELTV